MNKLKARHIIDKHQSHKDELDSIDSELKTQNDYKTIKLLKSRRYELNTLIYDAMDSADEATEVLGL